MLGTVELASSRQLSNSAAGHTTRCRAPAVLAERWAMAASAWVVFPRPMSSPSSPLPTARQNLAPRSWYNRSLRSNRAVSNRTEFIRSMRFWSTSPSRLATTRPMTSSSWSR